MASELTLPPSTRAERKLLAGLARRRERRDQGLVLCEGMTLLGEALAAGLAPQLVAVSDELRASAPETVDALLASAGAAGARLVALDKTHVDQVSQTKAGTGLVAAVVAPAGWDAHWASAGPALVPVLWGLQDPGNVGMLLRSARAFGATGCLLTSGSADPTGPKAVRASAGAALHLPCADLSDEAALDGLATDRETVVVTASPPRGAQAAPLSLPPRCLLVLGHETRGVPELAGARPVSIPQTPEVESLNVGVAGAVLMAAWYGAHGARRAEGAGTHATDPAP